jgi:hypothetical protein
MQLTSLLEHITARLIDALDFHHSRSSRELVFQTTGKWRERKENENMEIYRLASENSDKDRSDVARRSSVHRVKRTLFVDDMVLIRKDFDTNKKTKSRNLAYYRGSKRENCCCKPE